MGVGVQKAGTSWWHRLLSLHPGCDTDPDTKELHFFDRFWAQPFGPDDIAAYRAHFAGPADRVVGEWTPRYLHDPWVPPLLRAAAPDARLLVLLRDPLERYRSGLTHSLDWDGDAPTALVATDAFTRGLYGTQLARLYRSFDPAQVLVLQFERCRADPAGELRRTYEFCGLDPAPLPEGLAEPVLVTVGAKAPLPEAAARALGDAYADDLALLGRLVPDLDLDLWPAARPAAGSR